MARRTLLQGGREKCEEKRLKGSSFLQKDSRNRAQASSWLTS